MLIRPIISFAEAQSSSLWSRSFRVYEACKPEEEEEGELRSRTHVFTMTGTPGGDD